MEALDFALTRKGVLHEALPWLITLLDWVAAAIVLCAVLLLLVGALCNAVLITAEGGKRHERSPQCSVLSSPEARQRNVSTALAKTARGSSAAATQSAALSAAPLINLAAASASTGCTVPMSINA